MVEVAETQEIATLRIHVEREIQRVKDNNLFKTVISLSMVRTISQLWTIAVLLTNFQGPLIIEKMLICTFISCHCQKCVQ
ncbi:hypothetical protein LSH36_33g08018 [Paralvinella palmiformis]|uniref:DDE Tnp4 domain-containing protein n=1 Tax=Paralvinella palmiformis TaxID=53620 RepID=A0AAD9KAA3_9ANNE|nr:hypothetical protein LSH36_33g08018 [Paralvinella palmiformis]